MPRRAPDVVLLGGRGGVERLVHGVARRAAAPRRDGRDVSVAPSPTRPCHTGPTPPLPAACPSMTTMAASVSKST
jgi:hypothetical protein